MLAVSRKRAAESLVETAAPPASEGGGGGAADDWRHAIAQIEADGAARSRLEAELQEMVGPTSLAPEFYCAFLRAKSYDVPKTAALLKNYDAFRDISGWRTGVSAASTERCLRTGFNLLLPNTDVHGHVVVTQRMGLIDTSRHGAMEAHQRAGYYLLHRALHRPEAQTRGIALLLDFRGFDFSLLRRIGRSDLRRGVAMLQDCVPAHLQVIYVLHQPGWLRALVALLRPLLHRPTLKQKFILLGGEYDRLHAHIPAASLPERVEAGGTLSEEAFNWDAQVDAWVAEESAVPGFDAAALIETAGRALSGGAIAVS